MKTVRFVRGGMGSRNASRQLAAVASGAGEIVAGLEDGKVDIALSTASPQTSQKRAERVRARSHMLVLAVSPVARRRIWKGRAQ
jgi:3-hydroxyisobutyrate dehydrogenase-like beta-hydroxyacid dehydrogenase